MLMPRLSSSCNSLILTSQATDIPVKAETFSDKRRQDHKVSTKSVVQANSAKVGPMTANQSVLPSFVSSTGLARDFLLETVLCAKSESPRQKSLRWGARCCASSNWLKGQTPGRGTD
jgi:hypothetical protein